MTHDVIAIDEQEKQIAVPQSDTLNYLAIISQAARDPSVDTNKMQAILDMKREEEDREAKRAFNRAMVAAKREMKPVIRNLRNDHTKSNYADLMSIADQVDPIIEANGLAITYGTAPCERDGYYTMIADLLHEDGHEKQYRADIPIDAVGIQGSKNKTATHAFGSTTTYGRRYMKLMIFDIATKDDDGNGAQVSPKTLSEKQLSELRDLLADLGREEGKFVQYLNAQKWPGETLEDMSEDVFAPAKKLLEGFKAKEAVQ